MGLKAGSFGGLKLNSNQKFRCESFSFVVDLDKIVEGDNSLRLNLKNKQYKDNYKANSERMHKGFHLMNQVKQNILCCSFW